MRVATTKVCRYSDNEFSNYFRVNLSSGPSNIVDIEKEERPPGGAFTRIMRRSVMTFPTFWSEPFAKLLELAIDWGIAPPMSQGCGLRIVFTLPTALSISSPVIMFPRHISHGMSLGEHTLITGT
jgi:hypothetical protein